MGGGTAKVIGYDEFLNHDEVVALTGRTHKTAQVQWLKENHWRHELNAASAPIIGRWYARMKMAGVDMAAMAPSKMPDFSKIR